MIDSFPEADDAELLRRIAQSDEAAFVVIYDRYSPLLYSVAVRILGDTDEAGDVLQEVFLSLHRKAGTFDARLGRPAAWLCAMTRNRSLDHLKALKKTREGEERLRLHQSGGDHENKNIPARTVYHDEILMIREAVRNLPAEQRQALELAYFGGLTQQEISEKLSRPLSTIKARIRRGLLKLREVLDGLI